VNLAARTARGGVSLISSQVFRFLLQIITLAALARLLDPVDFGLFAMVTVLTNFLNLVGNLGLVQATVQRPKITCQEVSNLFWLNGAVGLLIALFIMLIAPFIVLFYGEVHLRNIVYVMGLAIFIQMLGLQHRALLERSFQFGKLAYLEIGSQLLGAIGAVALAYLGFSYWALVFQYVIAAGVSTMGLFVLSNWLPSFPKTSVSVRAYLTYGLNLAGFNFLNFFARNTDNILLGKIYGAGSLAIYQKAYALLMLPVQQINSPLTRVLLPALSQVSGDPRAFKNAYGRSIKTLAWISVPCIVGVGVIADELVLLVLGPKWEDSVLIFKLLLPAALVGATNVATGWAYLSLGHTDRQFKFSFLNTIVIIGALFTGAQYGLEETALAFSLASLILRIPDLLYCFKGTCLKFWDFSSNVLRPYFVSIISGLTALLIVDRVQIEGLLLMTLTKISIFTAGMVALDLILPGTKALQIYLNLVAILLKKQKAL